ncbi:MAG: prepilin-type N-terminal cleavage/methylation domain-containing protein [Phycisphaerae bacterium]|nr:prepilin-type N-terminal cleavage/methylation domain-containing protein [Phycisphaerae bacterium]
MAGMAQTSRHGRHKGSVRRPFKHSALTLLEMVIAIAIMAVVFAALLVQFRNINNSWASRQGGAEALQNGRILTDHFNRNLSKALRIVAVSEPAQTGGYIEYEAPGGLYRYEVSAGTVVFGPLGSLSELAGPVSRLQFTCYNAYDLDTPITDVDRIRVVRIRTALVNSSDTGPDKPFESLVYLRSNRPSGIIPGPSASFGITTGNMPALAKIDATHYLCAFTGQGDDGFAVVLTVDTATQTVRHETPFEYDQANGINPSLAQIDATRFLCVYKGPQGDGYAVILRVNPLTWTVDRGEPLEFEYKDCFVSSLARIDDVHFLCAYTGSGNDGFAVILKVDPVAMMVQSYPEDPYEFDTSNGQTPAMQSIGAGRFLCVYQGWAGLVSAVVLTVNMADLTIALDAGTPPEMSRGLGLGYGESPALARIDATRFLCTYSGNTATGMAVVLAVGPHGSVTRAAPFQFDGSLGKIPAVIQLTDNTRYLCAYQGYMSRLWATVLIVDPLTWNIRGENKTVLSSWKALKPDLAKIDDYNYLCVHEDQVNAGWGLLLNVGDVRP